MNASATPSPLAEFWDFARDFKSVTSWIAKAAVVAPLADIALNIGPPWPSRISVAILSSIVEVIVLMYSFEFWQMTAGKRHVQKVLRYAVASFGAVLVAYLFLFSTFIQDHDDMWNRVVIGYSMHEHIASMVQADPSRWTPFELLDEFHDVYAVWTPFSVNLMRTILLTTWLIMWATLGVIISSFVSLQWRRKR